MAKQKRWTKQEEMYLEKKYGKKPISALAETLGRTYDSVEKKLTRMGFNNRDVNLGCVGLLIVSNALKKDSRTILRYREKGFPVKTYKYGERVKHYIDVEEMWKWIECNKTLFDFTRIERGTLLPEPEWLNVAQKEKKKHYAKYTREEDVLIWDMFYKEGACQKDIATKIGRTRISVQKRLAYLRDKGA